MVNKGSPPLAAWWWRADAVLRSAAPRRNQGQRAAWAGGIAHYMQVRRRATALENLMAENELPAAVQGRLSTAHALDGAGSNDRGI